jgi:hypothetical protein
MAQDFHTLVTALWAKLKLGTPAFGPTPAISLAIDGVEVTLSESADGRHLVVSGLAGRLSRDRHYREQQVRKLLKANLGMLQSSRAGLSLEAGADAAAVRVIAVYPYAADHLDGLMRCIEDVLYRIEFHSGDLVEAGRTPTLTNPTNAPSPQDAFIIRP